MKIRSLILLLALTLLQADTTRCWSQKPLRTAQIEERLNLIVNVPSFSATAPLSQQELMKFVLDLRTWGAFPDPYRGAVTGDGGYISRPMVRLFVRELLGQDLQVWNAGGQDLGSAFQADRLTWVYNSSNTMYSRPSVHITRRTDTDSRHAAVQFTAYETDENATNHPTPSKIAAGSAALEFRNAGWVVTTWQTSSVHAREAVPGKDPRKARRVTGAQVADRLVSLMQSGDWNAVAGLWGGPPLNRAKFVATCKSMQRGRKKMSYEVNNVPYHNCVWAAVSSSFTAFRINLSTAKIVEIGEGDD